VPVPEIAVDAEPDPEPPAEPGLRLGAIMKEGMVD